MVNNKDAISKLENRLKLVKSMSFITEKDKKSQSDKETNDIKELLSIGFDAVQKLKKTKKSKKLTKKELQSVIFCAYNVPDMKESKHKKEE